MQVSQNQLVMQSRGSGNLPIHAGMQNESGIWREGGRGGRGWLSDKCVKVISVSNLPSAKSTFLFEDE